MAHSRNLLQNKTSSFQDVFVFFGKTRSPAITGFSVTPRLLSAYASWIVAPITISYSLIQQIFTSSQFWTSSETQGQSVGWEERARRKFSSTGERAPGYWLSPNYFQKFKRMPAPDWAQKCFVLLCPIGEQFLLSSFCEFVHEGYCFDHGLSGSCTKEMLLVRSQETFSLI